MPVARTDDGVSIAYRTHGAGRRNLVFLHTWGGSARYFDETIENLNPTAVRAITLDLRGHGDSDKPDAQELTLERVAWDVFTVSDDARVDVFVAVGHSMGGKFAQYLPLVDPSRVEGLVLVASPSAGELRVPEFITEWIGLAGDGRAILDAAVRPHLYRSVPEDVLGRFGEDWAKIPRAYLDRTAILVGTSFIDRLGSVRVPALVVAGARDPLHSEMRDELVASLPNARLELLDCGPEVPMELPAELAHLIEKFAAELP